MNTTDGCKFCLGALAAVTPPQPIPVGSNNLRVLVDNLVKAKGRYHTQLAYDALRSWVEENPK